MKDIAIYGSGGFGREVACLINLINKKSAQWNLLGFYDDLKEIGYSTEYGSVLGGINDLNVYNQPLNVIVAIGNPNVVFDVVSKIDNSNIEFPNIFASDTIFLDKNNVTLGKGNIFCSNCLLSCNVHIGSFNAFNGLVTIGHDTNIGNFNSVMPGVRISGNVELGDRNFLGVSAIVLQKIKIGNDTTIGTNSVIMRRTKDFTTYLGNPAVEILKPNIKR